MARASPIFCSMKHVVVCSGLLIGLGKKSQISQDSQRQIRLISTKFSGLTPAPRLREISEALNIVTPPLMGCLCITGLTSAVCQWYQIHSKGSYSFLSKETIINHHCCDLFVKNLHQQTDPGSDDIKSQM